MGKNFLRTVSKTVTKQATIRTAVSKMYAIQHPLGRHIPVEFAITEVYLDVPLKAEGLKSLSGPIPLF